MIRRYAYVDDASDAPRYSAMMPAMICYALLCRRMLVATPCCLMRYALITPCRLCCRRYAYDAATVSAVTRFFVCFRADYAFIRHFI